MRIRSFEEYEIAYKESVEDPEGFWGEVAQDFIWKNLGRKF